MLCEVCPHACDLADGETGRCLVRTRSGDQISSRTEVASISIEPIEKRPFFHFMPGSRWVSVGLHGCSLKCSFCQNESISQHFPTAGCPRRTPGDLWSLVIARSAAGVVFTYNEPTIHLEYLLSVAQHRLATKVAIKTNGFVTRKTLDQLTPWISAFNVDVKGDDKEYRSVCEGSLAPVLETVEHLAEHGQHLEISYLVLPRMLNSDFHGFLADKIARINPGIPVHVLYFFPFHELNDSYPVSSLLPVVEELKSKLSHVYVSNCFKSEVIHLRNTVCSSCGETMISRIGPTEILKTRCCGHFSAF